MARTQAADYEDRKDAIANVAVQLFASHGYLGASMSDVAAAAQMSKSLLYHYYKAKEDILFDAMAAHLADLEADAAAALARGGGADETLRDLFKRYLQRYVGAVAHQKVLLNELRHLPPARRREIVRRQRELVDIVQNLLTEIQPELSARPQLRRPVTMLVFGMINWTHNWFDPKGAIEVRTLAALAADLTIAGVRGLIAQPAR
jgi:AcrR family transcriptional regulator